MSAPETITEASRIAGDDTARGAVQRRVLTVVVLSQILGGAGLAAGITVGALLAQDMLGSDSLSGLPAGLFTLGSALAAFLVGRVSQARGRRIGLAAGFASGGLGAAGVVAAAVFDNVILLFVALFVYGAGTATNLQARYAGTDLAQPTQRGTAISIAMVSTTLGAVAGPNLVEPLGVLAAAIGVPALAGPFLLAAFVYLAAGAVLFVFLRPDPLLIARHIPSQTPAIRESHSPAGSDEADLQSIPRRDVGVAVGATVMVLTQITMIAIMTMTPVHMRAHGHGLGEVGLVIGIHVGAMYLPSLITGRLVDRVGRVPMAITSGVTLLAAGVIAALAPVDSLGLLILALALLGLGWNFGLIAGTALVIDATEPESRAKVQGSVDVLIALGGAGGGALSGVVVAGTSYATLSLAGGVLSLILIPAVLWSRRIR
ncbi:MFS transporter [Rhodococcus qingshengii]|uniref:MFS transporter n=1 Tax=Rhodococcus qingshengii TaxID=334542 RepID=UPI0036DD4B46